MKILVILLVLARTGFSQELEHDKWQTTPSDFLVEFTAYSSSFDSNDDDNEDGVADSLGVPHWVSYQLNSGGAIGSRPNSSWNSVPGLPYSPDDSSYRHSGYSRGHMCRRLHSQYLGR